MHEYPASRVGRGILFMLTAVAMFSCMNAVVKLLSADFHSIQIVWARTLGHFLFVMALFVPQSGFAVLRSRQLGAQFSRSILQMCSTALYFTALGYMGLAEATAIIHGWVLQLDGAWQARASARSMSARGSGSGRNARVETRRSTMSANTVA